jgi:UDP-N-acetylmuramoyl-L-alanyl-D-glutamate--2,6-diaminopimelate ligase
MKLKDLVPPGVPLDELAGRVGAGDVEIGAITADSRQVGPATLFAALPGSRFDGRRFIQNAIDAGAVAILTTLDTEVAHGPVPILRSADPRRLLAVMAARLYARQPEVAVAVTGTSGKTSVADFTRQIFTALGHRSASVGTIGVVKPDGSVYAALTTPDPVTLSQLLAGLADEGVTHVAFEASSHGLDQRRLDGVRLKAAAFTNLGRDHLDYHPTVEDYFAAKLRLFEALLPDDGTAVANIDDPYGPRIAEAAKARSQGVITVGRDADAEIRLAEVRREGFLQHLTITHAGMTHDVSLNLIGTYQASNAVVAAGLAIATGEPADRVFAELGNLRGVLGRLEVVGTAQGAPIVIDYAHKPDALDAALDALRPFVTGRLICVFGCGGDRDKGKRPIMGAIARAKADLTIITDDNPRGEDPETIRSEIAAAHPEAVVIGSRLSAITAAIAEAREGDVVLIAGKGHETGQIVGDQVLAFSDHDAVAAVLREL